MKANELRIGNYVNYQGRVQKIHSLNMNEVRLGHLAFDDFSHRLENTIPKPIPLTEDCGFELEDKYWDFVGFGTRIIYQDRLYPAIKIEKIKTQWAFYFNDKLINLKDYLHEAQNLYFALTNTELKCETK